ncbi:hypothetical protein, partial [uncultured Stenotrophomonas sp.]|uniref:hypothetical protein n=1 Tax=uncultured Stenotrophomonas sp. TaxID=165438 RepID=UPI0028056BB7
LKAGLRRCACSSRAEPMLGFARRPESSRAWARLYKRRPARLRLLLIFFFFSVGGAPTRPALSNPAFSDPLNPTHEGLRRWLETS